jgi:hypothetical protein
VPGSRKQYARAGAFRQALEERLKTISREEQTDFQRLCRQVAFDRFLARLARVDRTDWILKGGYAMELRFETARSTRDLDFTLREGNNEAGLLLLQRAAVLDVGGFFTFRVGEAMIDLDAAPYGGARHPVESRVDGRVFVRFHVDVGIGDVIVEPIETMAARDWLAFAEISPPCVPLIARDQQFAEKIHAYSLPRANPNSRVRDLVPMLRHQSHGFIHCCRWKLLQRSGLTLRMGSFVGRFIVQAAGSAGRSFSNSEAVRPNLTNVKLASRGHLRQTLD